MSSQQSSSPAARAKVRGLVGLATLAVGGVTAPAALATTGNGASPTSGAGVTTNVATTTVVTTNTLTAAGAAVGATTPAAATATAVAPTAPRLSGPDRIATAIAVADAAYGSGRAKASIAVLSRDDSFADALAGNALAAQKKGPLLLTGSAGLDPKVAAELKAILVSGGTVYLLGGVNALSDHVRADVAALGFTPKRLAGGDRFETAVAIAHEISPTPHTVLVATGINYPDALSAGAAAASDAGGGVVVLTGDKVLPAATKAYLAGIDPTKAVVYGVGGQAVAALGTLAGYLNHFVPFSGVDRFDTATQIARNATLFPAPLGAGIATGANWADALSGGAYVGTRHEPLLLADKAADSLSPGELAWLRSRAGKISTLTVLGGTQAVSDNVVRGAVSAATTTASTVMVPPTAVLSASNYGAGVKQSVLFNASGSRPGSAAIRSYTFSFGDGTPTVTTSAPTATAAHAFAKKGKFTVSVTVTDVDGVTSVATIAPFTVGSAQTTGAWTAIGGTGLLLSVANMDSHHHSGASGTKPSPWCGTAVSPLDPAAATAPLLFSGQSDDGQMCGSGWDTPGLMIKNATGSAVTIHVKVAVPRADQTTDALGTVTDAGNSAGSWDLWGDQVLLPGQSIILAQSNGNNFDPGDTNNAGQIGSPPEWCSAPSRSVPTITVTVNGHATTLQDVHQVLTGGGVDTAGCRAPSPGSSTRSDESFNWRGL